MIRFRGDEGYLRLHPHSWRFRDGKFVPLPLACEDHCLIEVRLIQVRGRHRSSAQSNQLRVNQFAKNPDKLDMSQVKMGF